MTPVMTMAARALSGRCWKTGVRKSSTKPISAALIRPAAPAHSKQGVNANQSGIKSNSKSKFKHCHHAAKHGEGRHGECGEA